MLGVVFALVVAQSPVTPLLQRARTQVQALQFSAASKTLQELRAKPGLTRGEVLDFFELAGVVAGSLSDTARATEAFRALLQLDPERRLKGVSSPRVLTPFLEVKAEVRDRGALAVKVTPGRTGDGRISALTLEVSGAPALVARMQVDLEEDGVSRAVTLAPEAREVAVSGRRVTARVRVEGGQGWELLTVGPQAFEAPQPTPKETVSLEPRVEPPMVTLEPAPPRFRPAAWTLGSVGAAALVTGAVFGIRSTLLRAEVTGAREEAGVIVGMSRQTALELEQQALSSAIIANTALIAGAAFLVGAVVLWFVGNAG